MFYAVAVWLPSYLIEAKGWTLTEAAFGGAMALVRLERYRDARDRLTSGLQTHPDQSVFAHALARLLVAAPDPEVRDGQRAKTLVDELLLEQQSIELGETTAMMPFGRSDE